MQLPRWARAAPGTRSTRASTARRTRSRRRSAMLDSTLPGSRKVPADLVLEAAPAQGLEHPVVGLAQRGGAGVLEREHLEGALDRRAGGAGRGLAAEHAVHEQAEGLVVVGCDRQVGAREVLGFAD